MFKIKLNRMQQNSQRIVISGNIYIASSFNRQTSLNNIWCDICRDNFTQNLTTSFKFLDFVQAEKLCVLTY